MIKIEGLTKRYGDVAVVDDVSLQFPRGGVTALVGPNGAGKSTLLCAMGRLVDFEAGAIHVDEMDVQTAKGADLARRLSILRQDNHLPVRLTVRELVEFGRFPHAGARLGTADRDQVSWAIDRLELGDFAARRLDQLSGGQRQRAFIAMVLCQDTDYIVLDEPLNNLDMRHAVRFMALVRLLADELDKTVIVVLHDINMAAGYADRIVAMRDAKVVADGPPAKIVNSETMARVFDVDIAVCEVSGQPVAMFFAPSPVSRPSPF